MKTNGRGRIEERFGNARNSLTIVMLFWALLAGSCSSNNQDTGQGNAVDSKDVPERMSSNGTLAKGNVAASPDSGLCIGDEFTLSGSGFLPNRNQSLRIMLQSDGAQRGSTPMMIGDSDVSIISDDNGEWSQQITIPAKAHQVYGYGGDDISTPGGTYLVQINFHGGAPGPDPYASTKISVRECNQESDNSSSQNERWYVGKYYARCKASMGVGYEECIIELGANGQMTGFYDGMPMYSYDYKIDGNQLKVDVSGDGTTDGTVTIQDGKFVIDGDEYVKR